MRTRNLFLAGGLSLLQACSSSPAPKSKDSQSMQPRAAAQEGTIRDSEPPASQGNTSTDFSRISLGVTGLPAESSDHIDFDIKIQASTDMSHFSYKVAAPDDCRAGSGYKVEPINSSLRISVEALPDGPVALCILKYDGFTKVWQNAADATAIRWIKLPFKRSIVSAFDEYDPDCMKKIRTQTVIELDGKKGMYSWVRDAKSQGCDQETLQGKDSLTIDVNSATELKGFWSYNAGETSGWFNFKWLDVNRQGFRGFYGYGEPTTMAAGPWNSIQN